MVRMPLRPTRALLSAALALGAACAAPPLARHEVARPVMGTTFRLVLYAPDAPAACAAAAAVWARLDELDGILSDYDAASELSRLSGRPPGELVPVSPELWAVLARAAEVAEQSGGAFDVTVGPCVRLWRRARRQGELPAPERLAAARAAVGFEKLALDRERRAVALRAPGMQLDLGGIAKGYALDEVLRLLRARGIERALIDGGGDVAAGAPPPGRAAWSVALEPFAPGADGAPATRVALAHGAAATSGDAAQYVEIDGVRYSHLLDPRTGLGLTRRIAATVLAPSGIEADALASALCVLGPERGLELVERTPGVEARVVLLADGRERALESSGFGRRMLRSPAPTPAPPSETGVEPR